MATDIKATNLRDFLPFMTVRADLVQNAVKFLSDPKVQEAPLAKRISFLESKGMTAEEIEAALDQVKGPNNVVSPPPLPPKAFQPQGMSWKDTALGLVGVAGASYGLFYLAQRFLSPYLDFPTAIKVEEDTKSIESQLSNSSKTLTQVTAQTKEIIQGMEAHAKEVTESLQEMNSLLEVLKANDASRKEDIQLIKKEVDELKRTFPKLIEKSKENQQQIIQEVQNELKSLKNLIMNRRLPSTNGEESSDPKIPTTEKFAGIKIGKPSIPAWQLAAMKDLNVEPAPESVQDTSDDQPNPKEEEPSDTDTAIHIGNSTDSLQ
jgi:peroxin-14